MDKKIASYFLLLLCMATFDVMVKHAKVFPVNLVVFYYVSIFGFIAYRMILDSFETRNKMQRFVLWSLLTIPIGRIFLNIWAIGQTRDGYNSITSNEYVDLLQWVILIILMIAVLWENFIR